MGIRGRLLALTLGVTFPLVLVGLVAVWGMWTTSRRQLENSLEQRAELAAVVLERWIEAERQPLATIAVYSVTQQVRSPALTEDLRFTSARPHWIDLRILDAQGGTGAALPTTAEPLPSELVSEMFVEIHRRRSWAVVTDLRTRGAERPVLAIGSPIEVGGAVMARVDAAAAIRELFGSIELSNGVVLAVFDPRGRILYRSTTPQASVNAELSNSTLLAALDNRRTTIVEAVSPYDGVRRVHGLARAGATDLVVMVGVPSEILYAPAQRQITRYLLFSFVALLCAGAAALVIARGIALPLRRLRVTAQALGAGDLAARAPVTGIGEAADVGAAFNQMASQIEEREARLTELDKLKSEFVSNVSHELRTPLTTIKTLTHVMLQDGQSEAQRREYLETIAAECDRQIDFVLNLFDLSRIEAGTFKISPEPVDVSELARACFMGERLAAEARGQDLRLDLPAKLPAVKADYGALRRVLCILVDNAVKYAPDGARITLTAEARADQVGIALSDTGRGIQPEDVPRVFEKFFRGSPVGASGDETSPGKLPDQQEAPGVGLGLYLARHIVEQMDGSISVKSEVGRGSIFTVFLPAWLDREGGDQDE